jgi:hypothetical protein
MIMYVIKFIGIIFLLSSNIAIAQQHNPDTVIGNIDKNCNNLLQKNIYDYYLCKGWTLLTSSNIKKILQASDTSSNHVIHYAAHEFPFWITASMSIDGILYELSINPGAYFSITNKQNSESSLFVYKDEAYKHYFLSSIGAEENENFSMLKREVIEKAERQSLKTFKKQWADTYTFKDNVQHKVFVIKYNKSGSLLYVKGSAALSVDCIAIARSNKQIDFYTKHEPDASLGIGNLHEGDYLFTLIISGDEIKIKAPFLNENTKVVKNLKKNK